jgi:hypothetical protein
MRISSTTTNAMPSIIKIQGKDNIKTLKPLNPNKGTKITPVLFNIKMTRLAIYKSVIETKKVPIANSEVCKTKCHFGFIFVFPLLICEITLSIIDLSFDSSIN